MEDNNKFQKPSFIPQGSSQGNFYYKDRSLGIWGLISLIVSIIFFGAVVVVYSYGFFLNSRINANDQKLAQIKENFQPALVDELLKFDSREKDIINLLSRYSSSYVFFRTFGESTVAGVRYNELDYKSEDGNVTFSAKGQSTSYDAIAFQNGVFKRSGSVINTSFNDFALNNLGNINFSLQGGIARESMSYGKFFEPATGVAPLGAESQNSN